MHSSCAQLKFEREQPVLHARDRHAGDVAVQTATKMMSVAAAHQERDQPLLEVVEYLHARCLLAAQRQTCRGVRRQAPPASACATQSLAGSNPVSL